MIQSSSPESRRLRVLHVIPSLQQGGAEAVLVNLINNGEPETEHTLCTLMPNAGHFSVNAEIIAGHVTRGQASLRLISWLRDIASKVKPDIIHSWMYHCNLLASVALIPSAKVIWSIHHASPATLDKLSTKLVSRACGLLSHVSPSEIVYVAHSAKTAHQKAGYSTKKGVIIPNGVDFARFELSPKPIPMPKDRIVVGMVARMDKVKGHDVLLAAIAKHHKRDQIHLIFAGEGCDQSPELNAILKRYSLDSQTTLFGAVKDVESIFAQLDILAIPSRSEALPMVALEAGAMGLPVIASAVGDLPLVINDAALLFEPDDIDRCGVALDAAIERRNNLTFAKNRREDLLKTYSSQAMGSAYQALYQQLAKNHSVEQTT